MSPEFHFHATFHRHQTKVCSWILLMGSAPVAVDLQYSVI